MLSARHSNLLRGLEKRVALPRPALVLWLVAACAIAVAEKPELVVQSGHSATIIDLAFSPDGKTLVSGSADNTVKLWEVSSGREFHTLTGIRDGSFVSFSSDGRYLATGGDDQVLRLWDAKTLKLLTSVSTAKMWAVAFSPDGKVLATGDVENAIRLWSVPSCEPIGVLEGHGNAINSIAFSPDGKRLVSTSMDKTLRVWDVDARRSIRTLGGQIYFERAVFGADGKTVFSSSSGEGLMSWDLDTGAGKPANDEGERPHPVGFSSDGSIAAFKEGKGPDRVIRIRELKTNQPVSTLASSSQNYWAFAFSSDGRTVAGGSDDGTIKLWDRASGQELYTLSGHPATVNSVAFSPNGELLAQGSTDPNVRIWNLTRRTELGALKGHARGVDSLSFSADGKLLASGSFDNSAKVWEVANEKEAATFKCGEGKIGPDRDFFNSVRVAISPDGRTLALGSPRQGVQLWNVSNGQRLASPYSLPNEGTDRIGFTGDGRLLATGNDRINPRITPGMWDLTRGQEIPMPVGTSHIGGPWVLSPDGTMLASEGYTVGTITILDVASGKEPTVIAEHSPDSAKIFQEITALAISPDKRTLAIADRDGSIQLLDVNSGTGPKLGPTADTIQTIAFQPGGRILASAGLGPRIRLWDVGEGRELLSLFSFPDGSWAVVDPEGRYDASDGGRVDWLHWVVDREIIELNQLKERYYEPGLLSKVLGFNPEPLRDVQAFTDPKLYPDVHVVAPDATHAKLGIHLTNKGGGIGRVEVLINGKEAEEDARKDAAPSNGSHLDVDLDVAGSRFLKPGEKNVVEVRAYNDGGYLVSRGVKVEYKAAGEKPSTRPSFWAIVAGTSDYAGTELHLQFAAKDAADMAAALEIAAERLFGKEQTHVTLLTTANAPGALLPTRENLRSAFESAARRARSSDVLVVYLSGHGVNYGGQGSREADYYYLTQEARSGDLTDPEVRRQTSVSSRELTEWIKLVPALKQVLVLDTCAAARLVEKLTEKRDVPSSQIRSLERMKDRTGLYILAGSAADAVSYEASRYGQGLLTYSLLLGIKGESLRENQFIDVSRWFAFATDKVPELARDIGGIQKPKPAIPFGGASFDVGQMLDEDKVRIMVAAVRPLFLLSNFQDDARPIDHLKLTGHVNEALRGVSARGRGADLSFIDASDFPDAYMLAGRYRVEGTVITVKVTLFRGDTDAGQFTVEGDSGKLDDLAANIVGAAERLLQKSPLTATTR